MTTDQTPKKAKKVAPPTDIDTHNADLKKATEAPKEAPMTKTDTLTTREVAEALDTTPRELRKFLRSEKSGVEAVGQGKRYELPATRVKALATKFDAWKQATAEAKAKKAEAQTEEETFAEGEEIELEVEVPREATEEELDEIIEELEAPRCEDCDKEFSSEQGLEMHLRRAKVHQG